MALDPTVGGEVSNSYVTLVEANLFFANHYSLAKSAAWVALTPLQGESVLTHACQLIDSLRVLDDEYGYGPLPKALIVFDFHDLNLHRLNNNQLLSFPRNIDVDSALAGYIPQPVKDAQCEQASYLLAFDESVLAASMTGLTEEWVQAGPVRTRQKFTMTGGTMIAPMAYELMRQYLRRTSRIRRA